jgi:hypothetical protein
LSTVYILVQPSVRLQEAPFNSDPVLVSLQWGIEFLSFRCSVKYSYQMLFSICPGRSTENFLAMLGDVRTCWGRIARLWQPESLSCETVNELIKHGLPIDVTGNQDM